MERKRHAIYRTRQEHLAALESANPHPGVQFAGAREDGNHSERICDAFEFASTVAEEQLATLERRFAASEDALARAENAGNTGETVHLCRKEARTVKVALAKQYCEVNAFMSMKSQITCSGRKAILARYGTDSENRLVAMSLPLQVTKALLPLWLEPVENEVLGTLRPGCGAYFLKRLEEYYEPARTSGNIKAIKLAAVAISNAHLHGAGRWSPKGDKGSDEEVDAGEIDLVDVGLVMAQVGTSRKKATKALSACDGDVINSIMSLCLDKLRNGEMQVNSSKLDSDLAETHFDCSSSDGLDSDLESCDSDSDPESDGGAPVSINHEGTQDSEANSNDEQDTDDEDDEDGGAPVNIDHEGTQNSEAYSNDEQDTDDDDEEDDEDGGAPLNLTDKNADEKSE